MVGHYFPGPQGPYQSFLAQEGRGGLPRAAGPHPGHFGTLRPGEGSPGPGTPTLGPHGLIKASWPKKAGEPSRGPQHAILDTLRCSVTGKGTRGLPPWALRGLIKASWSRKAGEASPRLWDPVLGTLGCGAPGQGTPTVGPQGPKQSFLAQEGWGGLPRAYGPHLGHFGTRRPGEGCPGQWTTTPGPQGPDEKFLAKAGQVGLPSAVGPRPGHTGTQRPGKVAQGRELPPRGLRGPIRSS